MLFHHLRRIILLTLLANAHALSTEIVQPQTFSIQPEHPAQPSKSSASSAAPAVTAAALGLAAKGTAISAAFTSRQPAAASSPTVATLQSVSLQPASLQSASSPSPSPGSRGGPLIINVALPVWAFVAIGVVVFVLAIVICVGAFGGCCGDCVLDQPKAAAAAAAARRHENFGTTAEVPAAAPIEGISEERGMQTVHDEEATERHDCVIHSILAHVAQGAWNSTPRAVSAEQCLRVRVGSDVSKRGRLAYDEIDKVLLHLGVGVLLIDVSVASKPRLLKRDPSGAAVCALVLQVTADHWEPVAHGYTCVLRAWDQAVRVARVITRQPKLAPEVIPQSGGTFYEGQRVGWGAEAPVAAEGDAAEREGDAADVAEGDEQAERIVFTKIEM